MIYFKTSEDQHVVILEPGNMEALKSGKFESTQNKAVMIAYTPDANWLGDQIIKNMDNMTPDLLESLIKQSHTRPEVKDRPVHPPIRVK